RRPARRPLRHARPARRPRRRRRHDRPAGGGRLHDPVLRHGAARAVRPPRVAVRARAARRAGDRGPGPPARLRRRLPLQHRHEGRPGRRVAGWAHRRRRTGPGHPRRHRVRQLRGRPARHLRVAGRERPPDRGAPHRPHSVDPRSRGGSRVTELVGKELVVVGNGMVGHRLVQAVRDRDTAGTWRITVLGEEPRPAYDRVALSSCVDGKSADDLTLPAVSDPLVQLHLGDAAVALDRDARVVRTASGAEFRYDALVLATGSVPFVPPVPGRDLPGCFVYRTLDDLDAIMAAAERAVAAPRPGRRSAVVVGGGLLGLEAARALRLLGLSPQVVEIAPRLMPMQVDEGGGAVLRRLVESEDLQVRCGVSVTSIAEDRGRLIATLSDGVELDADLVVFSAGIRPADGLARAAGLPVGGRGGVLVNSACRSPDPHIWAVGEVAALEGRTYGLVAPGYAMAEVVADRLLGGEATMTPAD